MERNLHDELDANQEQLSEIMEARRELALEWDRLQEERDEIIGRIMLENHE